MKNKQWIIVLLAFIFLFVFLVFARAAEYTSPMSLYKDNFFIAGNNDDQVKFQVSAKYDLFYSPTYSYATGIYLGYTQTSWWTCYGSSDTFSSSYQPEVFFQFISSDNPFDINLGVIDYIQVSPIMHCSTGVEGDDHRSINIYYVQTQLSVGEVYNFGLNIKGYGYYSKNRRNKDINEYRHNYEADMFFKLKSKNNWYVDKYEIHAKAVGNPLNKGYYMVEGICQIFTSIFQPKIFIQYNKGYSVNIVDYNKKEEEFRAGLIF